MTLSDMLGRELTVEWHEAVALVRDVIERAPALTAPRPQVPELHQIELLAWGQVEIHGGTPVAEPVQRLGQMLQSVMSSSEPPVQLRLLTSQATSPAKPYESVEAFAEALAFFERPHRASILQGLYSRAAAATYVTRPAPALTFPPVDEAPAEPETSTPTNGNATARRRRQAALVSAVLVTTVVLTAWVVFAKDWEGNASSAGVSALTTAASEGVGGVVASAVTAISERVGIKSSAAPEPQPVEPVEADDPAPARAPKKVVASRTGNAQPSTKLGRVMPDGGADGWNSAADLALPPTVVYRASEPEQRVVVATPPDDRVYSLAASDVTEPVAVRPQLPRELPAGVRPEDVARIELIIQTDGSVESVKLLTVPKNVHDWMLLSAAKAWRFRPALKNGVPVRYRKIISIAGAVNRS